MKKSSLAILAIIVGLTLGPVRADTEDPVTGPAEAAQMTWNNRRLP